MQRGNLVIYDNTGKIFSQTGEAEGDVLPHEYPIGIPYMEVPYGESQGKRLISIDVSEEIHTPIYEDVEIPLTPEERIAQLEKELAIARGEVIGG